MMNSDGIPCKWDTEHVTYDRAVMYLQYNLRLDTDTLGLVDTCLLCSVFFVQVDGYASC